MRRRLFEAGVDPDGVEHAAFEVEAERLHRLVRNLVSGVVEGGEHAQDFDGVAEPLVDALDGLEDLPHADEREVVAGDRHEHGVYVGEDVEVEEREARAAVHHDDVVAGQRRHALFEQAVAPFVHPGEEDVGAGEPFVAAEHIEVFAGAHGASCRVGTLDHHMVEALFGADAEADANMALRVGIDEEHPLASGGHARGDVDRGGGLTGAALLVEDGELVDRLGGRSLERGRELRAAPLRADPADGAAHGDALVGVGGREGGAAGGAGLSRQRHSTTETTESGWR